METLSETRGPEHPPSAEPRQVAVVLNGAAGALLDRSDAADSLAESFRRAGLAPTFIDPQEGDLPQRMEKACELGARMVVVAGGDGTVACAAQVAAAKDVTLGILPFGTMNLLAKDLGIPIGDLDAAIKVVAAGHTRMIDIGEVNGHVFLCASMIGLPTRLARYRESGRGRHSRPRLWLRFARAALRGFARYRARRFLLRLDERDIVVRASALTIVANRLDDSAGSPFRRSRLDGGALAIYIVKRLRLADAARLLLRAVIGGMKADPAMEERTGRTLSIVARGKTMRVMNDGESMLLEPPLLYRIRTAALRVAAPEPAA
jgi:diacylglycerol kinase family enzyme